MTNNRRLALIIANNQYENLTFAQLTAPVKDAEELARVFNDPSVGQFDDVKVLLNEHHSTIRRAIAEFFNQKKHDDMLVVYFSGHGVLDDQSRLFLAAKDSEPALHLLPVTAIPAQDICEQMDQCPSKRQVLILDCCYSGAFANGTKGGSTVSMPIDLEKSFAGNGQGRVILTASSATEVAWEGNQFIKDSVHSLFTHYLVEGLKSGSADLNEDGTITLDELYKYACEQVAQQTIKQTPSKWSLQQQGEIVIAQNPKFHKKLIKANHLPNVGYFTGRKSDLVRLQSLLQEQKLVIIEGLAGIGKTSLALEYAYNSLSDHESIIWHEIEQQGSLDSLLLSIATQLSEQGYQELLDAITDIQLSLEQRVEVLLKFLNQVKVLLIFDSYNNCLDKTHRVQKGYWTLMHLLYERSFRSRILLTSKIKPKVDPRLLGKFGIYDLKGLEKNDSNRLLLSLCDQVGYYISKAETEQICRLVEGHPFAIKIIVGLLHAGYPFERIQRELRQQIVVDYGDYLLNLLYQRLTRGAKRLLEACAAFRRSASIIALEKLPAEINCLDELLPLFLLELEPTTRLYTMHAIVRDYAYAKLARDKERYKRTHNAIAEYYEAVVRNPHRRPDFTTIQYVLEAEYHYEQADNLVAAGAVVTTLAQELRPILSNLEQEEQEIVDKFYRTVLAVSEKDAHVHYHFAQYLEKKNEDPEKIEFHYCEAARLSPHKFWLQYRAVYFLLKRTNYEKAQRILESIIDTWGGLESIPEQEVTQFYQIYINSFCKQGRFDEAIVAAKEGLQRSPQQGLSDLYPIYIKILRLQGRVDEAIVAAKEGLQRVPQQGLSNLYPAYIKILRLQGRVDEAIVAAKEGLQRVPQQGLSHLYKTCIQLLNKQGRLGEAIAVAKEGLQRVPQQGLSYLYKTCIQLLNKQGRLDEAIVVAKEALQRVHQEGLSDVYPAYIKILRKHGRLDEAIAVAKEALQRVHQEEARNLSEINFTNLYHEYVSILYDQNQLIEAARILHEGIQYILNYDSQNVYAQQSQGLLKQGALKEAIKALSEGLFSVNKLNSFTLLDDENEDEFVNKDLDDDINNGLDTDNFLGI